MNIVTIINKLKEYQLIEDTEEGLETFSNCFDKFGISLLLLKDESKFEQILSLLKEHQIPLQKENGNLALRLFAVDVNDLEDIINGYSNVGELDFLRKYPEIIAEAQTVHSILENIVKYQKENIVYKENDTYNISKLLSDNEGGVE